MNRRRGGEAPYGECAAVRMNINNLARITPPGTFEYTPPLARNGGAKSTLTHTRTYPHYQTGQFHTSTSKNVCVALSSSRRSYVTEEPADYENISI